MSRVVTSISFNLENDYERGLYEYAKGRDQFFGKYVKRLIDRDRAGIVKTTVPIIVPEETEKEDEYSKATIKAFF